MSFQQHRARLYDTLPEGSLVICYAGVPVHTNEDDYYNFEANSQFFYLTGLEREKIEAGATMVKEEHPAEGQETAQELTFDETGQLRLF